MAESFINLTEGSGKKSHTFQRTIGANAVEDDIIIAGEPYLASYTIGTVQTSWATANSHILQIMAGASLNVYVRRVRIYQAVVATAAAIVPFNIFRLSSAGTGGTTVTPNPMDTTDAASGATAMTLPTVKGTETASVDDGDIYFLQTIPTAVDFAPLRADLTWNDLRMKSIRIPAGAANGIALKSTTTAVAGATVLVVATIVEANF